MDTSDLMTITLIALQELVANDLHELQPAHSPQRSHEYRIIIFAIYSHMRSLMAASNLHFPEKEGIWNHQFIQILETIHTAFGTHQTHPYHEWPLYQFRPLN